MSTKEFGTDKKLEIENIFLGLGSNQGERELNLKTSLLEKSWYGGDFGSSGMKF